MIKALFFIIFIFSYMTYAEEPSYQAEYNPLTCIGIAVEYENMYSVKWTFEATGGSGSLVDIRYNGKKRTGKIRTTVYENGNLYGRGKWVGRTSSRIYNTLIEINYSYSTKYFELKSTFNPDNFRLTGKCSN